MFVGIFPFRLLFRCFQKYKHFFQIYLLVGFLSTSPASNQYDDDAIAKRIIKKHAQGEQIHHDSFDFNQFNINNSQKGLIYFLWYFIWPKCIRRILTDVREDWRCEGEFKTLPYWWWILSGFGSIQNEITWWKYEFHSNEKSATENQCLRQKHDYYHRILEFSDVIRLNVGNSVDYLLNEWIPKSLH